MYSFKSKLNQAHRFWGSLFFCLCVLHPRVQAATQSKKLPVVPKWTRFEHAFKSSVAYSNALQDATLTVVFTSPLGETKQVYGFWDGGKVWRVRFSPDQPGHWAFKTACSDTANKGLHNQSGAFLCTAATGQSRFNAHGPLRVARDRRHLEHADGTPFFWLADTVWNGARISDPKDWELYARTRASQKFTVAQWVATPGEDLKKQQAFSGKDHVTINPDFFRRLDGKLEVLSRAGILSAITPFSEMGGQRDAASALPDDQAALIVRYAVARWGADPVAWLLAIGGDNQLNKVARWKRIGRAVFSGPHSPVILFPGENCGTLEQFHDQDWVDAFGCQSLNDMTDDAVTSALNSPFLSEWKREPTRPLIAFAPLENSLGPVSRKRINADDLRRSIFWSLLMTPAAGISYGAQGVANWDTTTERNPEKPRDGGPPMWQRSLFMPGAKELTPLFDFVNSTEFWRLRPEPQFVANQPASQSPKRFIAAAGTEVKDLVVVYIPEDRTLEILLDSLPSSPVVGWRNPRTGENSPAVAVVGGRTCQFPTPDPGDWLLVMKAGK